MIHIKPIPYSAEELDELFALDANIGMLKRRGPSIGRKAKQSTEYRQVSIKGVQYPEHRVIWIMANRQPIPEGMEIDHINRDPTDNRPSNLRAVTTSQNQANTGIQHNNSIGFKGVFRSKYKFRAAIMERGVRRYLGSFPSAEAAARVYDEAAHYAFGECALTNAALGILPKSPSLSTNKPIQEGCPQ